MRIKDSCVPTHVGRDSIQVTCMRFACHLQEKLRHSLATEVAKGDEPYIVLPSRGTEPSQIIARLTRKVGLTVPCKMT